ncbi:putative salicylate hydroxylase [Triangularia verruculosa]|uniref:Salicylate hydroxylase n=1 Tax=Triangularia verruculosa TaxID=2587418 RepID=A0AAN7AV76_9PEZI|nr:putative salicylate hydroxylase [Triangularia verruculosa]
MGEKSKKRPFQIGIIGGGIAGLSTALFLHHFCPSGSIEINIYEQAEQYREIGAGINLGVNATKLLHQIGLGDEINAIAGSKDGVFFTLRRWDNSEEITTIYSNDSGNIRQAAVSRAELLQVLLDAIKARSAATLHTKKKCQSVTSCESGVKITFTDATAASCSILIASDGIHSPIRSQYLRNTPPIYSGKIVYRGLLPFASLPKPWPIQSYHVMWIGPNKHLLTYPISQGETQTLNFVGCITTPESDLGDLKESWSATCARTELERDFGDCDGIVQKVIELLPEEVSKWKINDREAAERWVFEGGKVALVGDAAHPMVPHQSAGAGQAVEDAFVIGRAMAGLLEARNGKLNGESKEWMELYEKVRMPRASKVQETSRGAGYLYQMQAENMKGKSYDECVPVLRDTVQERMKWIWEEELEGVFEEERERLLQKLEQRPGPGRECHVLDRETALQ